MSKDNFNNENIEYLPESIRKFRIKDLDTGTSYDIRNNEDSIKLENEISRINRLSLIKMNYKIENKKIKEKINTKFFKACERGDLEKVNLILNKKSSEDRMPDINEKFLHDFTVLHIAITNRKKLF
jgi:ankyrin repeat protein